MRTVSPKANLRFDRVTTDDGCELTLFARLRLAGRAQFFQARLGARGDAEASDAPLPDFAARRLKDEWLIVVSNIPARQALAAYRKRRAIECMFGDAKTRGLNLEDTRLTHPRKLALLMALVALAIARAGRAAATLLGQGSPKRKSHGYFARSWFRIGFDRVRNLLSSGAIAAIDPWRRLQNQTAKHLQKPGVV